MRKLNDLNHSAVDSEIIEAIHKAALMLTVKATNEHAVMIWSAMKDKVIRHYGYTEVSEVVAAIDNGSCGKYGVFKTLNGLVIIDWIKERRKEMETYKPSVESREIEREKLTKENCDPSYPKAVLMRIKFDPGGEIGMYSLDEIADEIRKGNNIFLNRPCQPSDFEAIVLNKKLSFS